jgi:hypothetical protein
VVLFSHPSNHPVARRAPGEVDVALAEAPTLAYRDSEFGLTVVWHYDQTDVGLGQTLTHSEEAGGLEPQ